MSGIEYDHTASGSLQIFVTGKLAAVESLEMAEHFLGLERPGKWLWAARAIYDALSKLLLENLGGAAPSLYLADRSEQQKALVLYFQDGLSIEDIVARLNAEANEQSGKSRVISASQVNQWLADPKVIGIAEAVERMTASKADSRRPSRPASVQRLVLTDEQSKAIDWLTKEIRNKYEHFMPKHWYIYVRSMRDVLLAVLPVIRFLLLDAHGVILDEDEEDYLARLLERIETQISQQPTTASDEKSSDVENTV